MAAGFVTLRVYSIYYTARLELSAGPMKGFDMAKEKVTTTFGPTIIAWREAKEIGLRRFADLVGMSPTYLSKVERGDFPPPGEEKIKAIAKALEKDADEVLALANRVASDLSEIIQRTPREMATFLRAANGLTPKELERLTRQAERRRGRGNEPSRTILGAGVHRVRS